jgi:signal transduction histidine kinase
MLNTKQPHNETSLPWWTWLAPFVIFCLCELVSQRLRTPSGSLLFYLPIAAGIILIHWWGPRVLVGLFLKSVVLSSFTETIGPSWHLIHANHEMACIFASWYLFSHKQRGSVSLPDIASVLQFILLGIIIPITINAGVIYAFSQANQEDIWEHLTMVWTADFSSSLSLALPFLFFLTPWLERHGLSVSKGAEYVRASIGLRIIRPKLFEISTALIGLLVFSIAGSFEKYWFIHGLFCVYIALRFGFGLGLLANMTLFVLIYLVLPFIELNVGQLSWKLKSDLISVHFGMCLLSMTACIIGRVISDLRRMERRLNYKLQELEQAHYELDKFVYSISHDLSAPLKSILGLVSVSKLEPDPVSHKECISRIEICAKKLDVFINEVLDYSRNSHLDVSIQPVNLRNLTNEVLEGLNHFGRIDKIDIRIIDHEIPFVLTDRMRLKIIINNLLSNAAKFQQFHAGHTPSIVVRSELGRQFAMIHIEDNGQGIREEHIPKLFEMFFRGSLESNGSGLGLYIAKEAAAKVNGKITVKSIFGQGSRFTVHLPLTPEYNHNQ